MALCFPSRTSAFNDGEIKFCPVAVRQRSDDTTKLTTYFKCCATLVKVVAHSDRFGAAHIQYYLLSVHRKGGAANRILLLEIPISNPAINTNSLPFKRSKPPREKPEMHQTIKRGIMATKLHSSPPSFLNR